MKKTENKKIKPSYLYGFISLCLFLVFYGYITSTGRISPLFLPSFSDIASGWLNSLKEGTYQKNLIASLKRVLIGYSLGCVLAIIIGSLMGWIKRVDWILNPFLQIVRPIPALAYIPLTILWFGIGETSKLFVITLGAFVSCIINVITGIKNTPLIYIDAARTLGANNYQLFLHIALPAAMPYIFTGLRVALATAWGVLVAAELIAAQAGIGFMLVMARRFVRTDMLFVGLITIGLLAFVMDTIIHKLEIYFTNWMERK